MGFILSASVSHLFLMLQICVCSCRPTEIFSPKTSNENETTIFCPSGEDWCDDPVEYPEDKILEALEMTGGQFVDMFDDQYPSDTGGREIDIDEDYENICQAQRKEKRIRASRNKKGEFQFIVNFLTENQTFYQIIPLTICTNAGEDCGHGQLWEWSTRCKQEYRDITLLVFTSSGQLALDTFTFPSCCVCLIRQYVYK